MTLKIYSSLQEQDMRVFFAYEKNVSIESLHAFPRIEQLQEYLRKEKSQNPEVSISIVDKPEDLPQFCRAHRFPHGFDNSGLEELIEI